MAIAAAAVSAAALLNSTLAEGPTAPARSTAQPPAAADLTALLSRVTVVDHISDVDGYERSCRAGAGCVFGPAWNDPADRSGCDTRNRILAAQLVELTFKPGTGQCKVAAGVLATDPYTGQRVDLDDIEIDHIYSLSAAWDAGAWRWTPEQRQAFANDPVELLAVSGPANRQKSDSRLDEWLPTHQPCSYIHRYLTVAAQYQLPITTAERDTATNTCSTPLG